MLELKPHSCPASLAQPLPVYEALSDHSVQEGKDTGVPYLFLEATGAAATAMRNVVGVFAAA